MIRLSVHDTAEAAASAAATRIADIARGGAHVALAGGNTPRRAYELLGLLPVAGNTTSIPY